MALIKRWLKMMLWIRILNWLRKKLFGDTDDTDSETDTSQHDRET